MCHGHHRVEGTPAARFRLRNRAEAGETLLITVSGRPGAVLGPVSKKQGNRYSDNEDVFDTPTDHTLADDLAEKNDTVQDPWTR